MDVRGWVPATAGNLSARIDSSRIAITASGCHKGFLTPDHIMAVDLAGAPLSPGRPSAETGLHCQLYRLFPQIGAVLHGHSVAATVLSRRIDETITFEGYEIAKALGHTTHLSTLRVPVVDNMQDIDHLAAGLEAHLRHDLPGYVLRGHGVYVWGADLDSALARLEALEFLLACRLAEGEAR